MSFLLGFVLGVCAGAVITIIVILWLAYVLVWKEVKDFEQAREKTEGDRAEEDRT